LGVRKLAAAAKVSPDTVVRFERGERLRERTVASLQQVLEAAGIEFIDGNRPGVRVKTR
jgi:transcriptional regulator with XRE-family HTH domain